MKIRKPTTKLTEIGPLDGVLWLPTAERIRLGMKTTCRRCGRAITDDHFVGGYKAGHVNMLFHRRCLDEQAEALLVARIASDEEITP